LELWIEKQKKQKKIGIENVLICSKDGRDEYFLFFYFWLKPIVCCDSVVLLLKKDFT
jgi:hypothetical protein